MATKDAPERQHKATWAYDKRNPGQYLVRVIGPNAGLFAGREVPVTRKDDTESTERLVRAVWAGVDEETKRPVALYTVEAKPKEEKTPDDLSF